MRIKVRKDIINRIVAIIVALYVNFTFVFGNDPTLPYLIYYLIMSIFIIAHISVIQGWIRSKGNARNKMVMALVFWVIILINSILFPIIHNTWDFSYISVVLSMPRQCIQQLFILLIVNDLLSGNLVLNYMTTSVYSGIVYVLSTVAMLIFPSFRVFWTGLIYQPEHNIELSTISYYRTRFGLMGFSGFDATLVCSILVLFELIIIASTVIERKKVSFKHFIAIGILLTGNLFYGRIGLILSVICVVTTAVVLCFVFHKVSVLFRILFTLLVAFVVLRLLKDHIQVVNTVYIWAMTPIINLLSTGNVGTASFDRLMEMHFMPPLKTLLIGDGYYMEPGTGRYYMHTDVGFLRPTLLYGVFNLIIGYFSLFFTAFAVGAVARRNKHSYERFFVLLFIFAILFCEFKGGTYYRVIGYCLALWFAMIDVRRQHGNGRLEGQMWLTDGNYIS